MWAIQLEKWRVPRITEALMNRKITVLITSAGSRAAEAIVASLQEVRHEIRLVGTNSVAEFVCISDLDAVYLVPLTKDVLGFARRMRDIVTVENPDVILNGRDEEVALLAALAAETGCLFLGPPPWLTHVFADKYQTYKFARSHDLPFVETAVSPAELDQLLGRRGFPLIAKPRIDGHAGKDVFLLFNRMQADRMLTEGRFVIQPYMGPEGLGEEMHEWGKSKGMPWTWNPVNVYHQLDFVVGEYGTAVSMCVTRAERSGNIIQRMEVLDDAVLDALAHRHIEVLGRYQHAGPVNVQGYLDREGQFCSFEWNSRFVGSVDGLALLGKNLVVAALADRFPLSVTAPLAQDEQRVIFRPMMYKAVSQKVIRQLALNGSCQAIDFAN